MNAIFPAAQPDTRVFERSIRGLGLRENPFNHLESSTDPHLGNYFVGHELFVSLLEETPLTVFAEAGAGKTAARIYAARACWFGLGGAQIFPLPYLPRPGVEPTPDAHRYSIARAGAAALFIGLLHRPGLFLALAPAQQRKVLGLLDRLLPSRLTRYIAMLRGGETPPQIAERLAPSYVLPSPPAQSELTELLGALDQRLPPSGGLISAHEGLSQLLDVLRGIFGFRAVLLQIDGVDASAESMSDLQAMADIVEWPLQQAAAWAKQRFFVKATLPADLEAPLLARIPSIAHFPVARIVWTPDRLAEVVRRRVYVASGQAFGSFDAMSSPALRDVELKLARIAAPLPREIVLLASCLLHAYALRAGDSAEPLEPDDIAAASKAYAVRRTEL